MKIPLLATPALSPAPLPAQGSNPAAEIAFYNELIVKLTTIGILNALHAKSWARETSEMARSGFSLKPAARAARRAPGFQRLKESVSCPMASNDFASEMMKLQELANLIGISGRQQDLVPRFEAPQ